MSSIGPQLPPHLQKRKRTEDEAELGSPPPKTSRRGNDDEIALDDGSDDDYGPSAPAPANGYGTDMRPSRPGPAIGPSRPPTVATRIAAAPSDQKRSIGPSLPPSAAPANSEEISLSDESDDDTTGPAPPLPKAGPAPPPKRVLGPAPPPADLSKRPPTNPDSDDDSDDDDGWGPALPGSSAASRATAAAAARARLSSTAETEPGVPKRDDWMIAPPTSSGYRETDPTKLKSRKFASGPRAATEGKPTGVSSIWTETPEEKARRLANAVLGREDPNAPSPSGGGRPSHHSEANNNSNNNSSRADEGRIKSYIEQTRGKSLVEQHQTARAAGKAATVSTAPSKNRDGGGKWGAKGGVAEDDEDDPSKRAFDWEKDMKVGGQISNSQRKELLNKAANFGGRFQSGKYL
ncbi:hypothetical protein C8A00DRAFT_45646 [Chaetomidium leptoderma]|uniref:DUF3752 domain-containing protein n=1 Tax=Chaetomidium leptoderma TaxID=669021 RepID=A0AAN6VGI6_9PEZI|nr:hypothetical protein C8A00DRAFT_45646 [Chaetomidium leptoderma]